MTILAWHGDPDLKARAVERMRAHREADDFIQGRYLDAQGGGRYRGCFHGCLTAEALAAERGRPVAELQVSGSTWHKAGERIWRIPQYLGAMLDDIFETIGEPGAFAVAATEAIPVGADLFALDVDDLWDRWEAGTLNEAGILAALAAAPVPAAEESTNA